jgi:EmrB/QacA subfamily drug resistance transporter
MLPKWPVDKQAYVYGSRSTMNPEQQQAFYDQNPGARWLVLGSICLAVFITSMALSAVNIAIPTIAKDLQADAVAVSWIPTSLLWGTIVLLLPAGRIADMVGRKKIYLVGVLSFSVTSMLVLLVDSIESLLVVRVLQGLSSSMIYGTGMAIISAVFANSNRGSALGWTSSAVYLGLTIGPVAGGWVTELSGWRSVFWMPVPLMAMAGLVVMASIRGDWKSETRERLDWLGMLIFIAWVSAFFLGISGLPEVRSFALVVLGIALLILFLKQQSQSEYPLVRVQGLRENRVLSRSLISSFLMYGANFPVIFLLSLYLQYIHNMSPAIAGQWLLIQTLMMVLLAPVSGRLSDRYEPRIIATIGCLCFSVGFALLIWIDMDTPIVVIALALGVLGVGFGLFSSPNNNAAMGSARKNRLSTAAALLNLSRTMGNMMSTAIVMLLFAVAMGRGAIEPSQYPQLLWVVQVAFTLSCFSALLAGYFSFTRGQVHLSR